MSDDMLERALGIAPPLRDVTDPFPPKPAWEPPPVVFTEDTWIVHHTAKGADYCRAGLRLLRRLASDEQRSEIDAEMAKLEQVG